MRKSCSGIVRAGAIAFFLSAPLALSAAGNPVDTIKYRQNVMKANGGHAAAAAAIIEGRVEFKDQLADHARALEMFTRNIPALFPAGTETGADTRALDAVWKNRADFENKAKDMESKAAAFAKAAAAGDEAQIKTAFKDVDKSCSACHKDFRKKKN